LRFCVSNISGLLLFFQDPNILPEFLSPVVHFQIQVSKGHSAVWILSEVTGHC
jgi:hypothetical protein